MKKIKSFLYLAWKACPSYIVLLVLQAVTQAVRLWLNVILPKFLVDELLGGADVRRLIIYGGLIVLNNVGMTLLEKLYRRMLEPRENYMRNAMNKKMAEKIMNLEYSYLEEPYYLDLKERAVFALTNQGAITNLVIMISDTISKGVTLAGLLVIMATLGPFMILVLAAGIGIMLLLYKSMSTAMVEVMSQIIPINRKYGYYMELETEKQHQKDIRLYNMSGMIADKVMEFSEDVCDMFDVMLKKQGRVLGGMNIVNDAIAAISYGYVGLRTISDRFGGRISIGSLTMYVTSAINFTSNVLSFGTSIINTLQNLSFLEPYMEFMAIKEETREEGKIKFEGKIETLEFNNVTFTYPKAEKPVLKNVSFSIRRGEKISIVGLNGAGKSTLVKLICRMYKADSGEIKINGKSIYDYDYGSYMKGISAVFQDYRLFNFTIGENISCQDRNADNAKINRLIEEVGLGEKIASLKEGINSRFGKEYDKNGIEMSGGEGQKVAIARALYKESSMVILDEPASALDPISEAEIYEKFNSLVEDKTAIYISHRMSSSVFCDRILIIDGGCVADFDTHEHLMKKTDSLYYKLFHSQAENYKLEEA
ncbi:MAG: ABC transporter ATP-binding protein/permease [Lachnospiraceae bacterium]